MRHSFKGASALAALCAGALAFGSVVPAQANVPGASGNPADIARVAGIDRTQTALEATTAATTIDKFFIVGHDSQVDALTLAPWNCPGKAPFAGATLAANNNGYVIYAKGNALEDRNLKVLKANPAAEVYIIGGTKAVAAGVESQIRALNAKATTKRTVITRVGGVDRYDTAYQVGAFIQDRCYNPGKVLTSKLFIDKLNADIAVYNAAVAEYNAAAKGEVAAQAALDAADAKVAAAAAHLLAVTPKVVDTEALKKELAAAQTAAANAKRDAQAKIDLLNTIFHEVAVYNNSLPDDEKLVTLQDFVDNAKPDHAETVAKLKKIAATPEFGITLDMKLNDAIAKAKTLVAQYENDKLTASLLVSNVIVKWDAVISGYENNWKIRKEVVDARKAYDAALVAQANAVTALAKAKQRHIDAIAALEAATGPYLNAVKDMPGAIRAFNTAMAKAYQGSVAPIFVSTGINFADALAAGPAAAKQSGVVLLTAGEKVPSLTKYALDVSKAQSIAIGGPAARAMKAIHSQAAISLTGKDRYHTAVMVAKRYFADGTVKGSAEGLYVLASGEVAADAVVAGSYLTSQANYGGILLTKKNSLPKVTANFLSFGTTGANQTKPYIGAVAVFGGTGAIAKGVFADAKDAAHMQ